VVLFEQVMRRFEEVNKLRLCVVSMQTRLLSEVAAVAMPFWVFSLSVERFGEVTGILMEMVLGFWDFWGFEKYRLINVLKN
jgi:hypothetical protein